MFLGGFLFGLVFLCVFCLVFFKTSLPVLPFHCKEIVLDITLSYSTELLHSSEERKKTTSVFRVISI